MKAMIQKWGISIYILLLSAHLYSQILGSGFSTVQFITKVLLLPTLMLYLAAQDFSEQAPKGKWFVLLAMFGSFLGDVLLTFENLFILGMVAFMTTHVFNILMFAKINALNQHQLFNQLSIFKEKIECQFIRQAREKLIHKNSSLPRKG